MVRFLLFFIFLKDYFRDCVQRWGKGREGIEGMHADSPLSVEPTAGLALATLIIRGPRVGGHISDVFWGVS